MSTKEIIDLASKYLMGNVSRYQMAFDRGQGMWLWDADGKKYLDFLGGIATCALGYAPEAVIKTLTEQASRLIHVSNYFYTQPLAELAELVVTTTGLGKVFFCNSGAEAHEAAIKLARH